jgi:hypothetical protein
MVVAPTLASKWRMRMQIERLQICNGPARKF